MDALTGWQCTLFWKGIRNNRNVHVMCCFKGVIFSCFSYKVVEFQEIVQKEDCFQDKEFELIKQCCERQMIRRLNLSQVREGLEEMNHLYTGTIRALFCFYFCFLCFFFSGAYIHLCLFLLFFQCYWSDLNHPEIKEYLAMLVYSAQAVSNEASYFEKEMLLNFLGRK